MSRGIANGERLPSRSATCPKCWYTDACGPRSEKKASTRLRSMTWPRRSGSLSRARSAARTANAPYRPVEASAIGQEGSVGGPSGMAVAVGESAEGLRLRAERGARRRGTALAVPGDAQHDEARVARPQLLGREAEGLELAGTHVLDEHV